MILSLLGRTDIRDYHIKLFFQKFYTKFLKICSCIITEPIFRLNLSNCSTELLCEMFKFYNGEATWNKILIFIATNISSYLISKQFN